MNNDMNDYQKKDSFKKNINSLTKEENQKVEELRAIVKKMNKGLIVKKNKEIDFRDNNKNKEIIIFPINKDSVKGTLIDIDKYKIQLQVDDSIKYYYKHSLEGYQIMCD